MEETGEPWSQGNRFLLLHNRHAEWKVHSWSHGRILHSNKYHFSRRERPNFHYSLIEWNQLKASITLRVQRESGSSEGELECSWSIANQKRYSTDLV